MNLSELRVHAGRTERTRKEGGGFGDQASSQTLFKIQNISAVRLWTPDAWVEGQPAGSGKPLEWELAVDSEPVRTPPPGLYVFAVEAVDFDTQKSEFVQLMPKEKAPTSSERFHGFWEAARKIASGEPAIIEFRKSLVEGTEALSGLEVKLETMIKHSSK